MHVTRTAVIRRTLLLLGAALRPKRRARMSWTCHGTSNDEMVDALVAAELVADERAVRAMRAVDRKIFSKDQDSAYQDQPHGIGYGATISAPHMHATCLELMKDHLQPGCKVLDVGSGSGYLTAVMGHMIRTNGNAEEHSNGHAGKAVGIEHIPELTEAAVASAEQIPFTQQMLRDGALIFITGDGLQGYPPGAPYDAIHVGASASQIPEPLVTQLAPGGRLVLPVGKVGDQQHLTVVDKDQNGRFLKDKLFNVAYIPLTTKQEQLSRAN